MCCFSYCVVYVLLCFVGWWALVCDCFSFLDVYMCLDVEMFASSEFL